MFDGAYYRSEFKDRISSAESLLNATSVSPGDITPLDVSRETRGLIIVLLYAAYENLLTSLCRGLLEAAMKLRVGNHRLQPGLKLLAIQPKLKSMTDSPKNIWKTGATLVATLSESRRCTVSPSIFPNDGTNFKRSQLITFCEVFGLGDPAPILREVWETLDAVVQQRNNVAHGLETPENVGRIYSEQELRTLIQNWSNRWTDFINWVESQAVHRDFYRRPR